MNRFFVDNKRDGARLISSGLLVLTIAITQIDHLWGKLLFGFSLIPIIYWSIAYKRLED